MPIYDTNQPDYNNINVLGGGNPGDFVLSPAARASSLQNEMSPMPSMQPPGIEDMLRQFYATPGRGPASVTPNLNDSAKVTQQKQVKDNISKKNAYEDEIRKYMKQKEDIAIDTKARMDKLDASYANRGTDYTTLLKGIEHFAGAKDGSLTNLYDSQRPMTPEEYNRLKEGLANKYNMQVGSLLNEAQQNRQQADLQTNRDALVAAKGKTAYKVSPLSQGAFKIYNGLSAMYHPIQRVENLLNDDTGTISMPRLRALMKGSNWISDDKLGAVIRMFSEAYGRMQSGAAIKDDEEKRFTQSLFKIGDSPELVRYKIGLMKTYIKTGARGFMIGRDPNLPALSEMVEMSNLKSEEDQLSPEDRAKARQTERDMIEFKEKRDRDPANVKLRQSQSIVDTSNISREDLIKMAKAKAAGGR